MNLSEFYKDKKVLVTGHTGFKGSWLCSILLELNAEICGIALEPSTNPNLFNQLDLKNRISSHNIIDIRNLNEIKKVFNEFKPEIVIHLAAQPLVIESYENPVYTYDVNVMGTVNICECIRHTESVKSFVNVTTDKVYENIEEESHAYLETDRLNGYDPYSNSKSCSELITDSYRKSFFNDLNIATSTCRAGNVIGGGDYSANRIIPDCFRAIQNNESILVRNPNSIRPYQHVLEADIFYLMLAMKQSINITLATNYNIGPDELDCITTGQLCDIVCNHIEYSPKWNAVNYFGPHESGFLKLSNIKARKNLNYAPRWSSKEAIEFTIDWYIDFLNKKNMTNITQFQIKEFLKDY
ncbi:CDP-glucose 4,6-dehydratase [Anaerorhabdus furcosa]|uniref:CDP-glucose 4,6-dehydratase n=1 Tax=Anaerorhabdus furcosa TaxID=118967 RepID=A0A1T4LT23_9FIRM|nr:CDP-glucose 4,6-dehydratase [Anaerorhabdus furcosa]SJZ57889.1 CDP-glucose 4,6-dehydratase [Anaerorhabdus furcosa]